MVGRHHQTMVEEWKMKEPRWVTDSDAGKGGMEIVKMNLKGRIWSVIEEFFKSTYNEEMKQNIGDVVEDVMNVIQREEVSLEGMLGCRKKGRETQMAEMNEQCGVFLEEELVSSMMHNYQRESSSLIGAFEFSLLLEASELACSEVGLVGKRMEEANSGSGPSPEGQTPTVFNASTSRMGLEEPVCSGPECPPGFEDYFDVFGPSKSPLCLGSSKGNFEHENFLEEEN